MEAGMEWLQLTRELVSIAAGLAVIVGVGWGLKLARQIVKTKDATIEQQQATIERLEKISSGPLADELEAVTGAVNKYIGKSKQLELQLEKAKEQQQTVVGVAFMEGYLAIEELLHGYRTAASGFDALKLPLTMRFVSEELFEQGQRAFDGQEVQPRRVTEALARQKS